MADTFTPSSTGTPYSFNQDACDVVTGNVPTALSAAYINRRVPAFTGTQLLKNADSGVTFSLVYEIFDDVSGGTGSGKTALVKYNEVIAIRGEIGTISKGSISTSGVVLLDATPPIKTRVGLKGSLADRIECVVTFQKVD